MPTIRPRAARAALLVAAALAAAAAAAPAAAQEPFRFSGPMTPGSTAYVRNMNGGIRIEAATGSDVEVRAEKRVRRGDASAVKVTAEMKGSNLLVCVIWVKRDTRCDEGGYRVRDGWGGSRSDDVSVEVTIALPRGVRVDASTVNGGLDIEGATAAVEARTVNGSITARSTGGPVQAKTVNGGIRVRTGAPTAGDLEYETVNGGITVELPATTDANIDARTVNGGIESEFAVTVEGRLRRNELTGTIGKGGRKITLSAVNGGIRITKY